MSCVQMHPLPDYLQKEVLAIISLFTVIHIHSKLSTRDDRAQQTEVSILRYLSSQQLLHPNHNVGIIDLIDFFSDTKHFHIVMELAEGGDVFDRLAKRKVYTEKDARDLARRMLESIQFVSCVEEILFLLLLCSFFTGVFACHSLILDTPAMLHFYRCTKEE
jgi:serine/threonine protein kinase